MVECVVVEAEVEALWPLSADTLLYTRIFPRPPNLPPPHTDPGTGEGSRAVLATGHFFLAAPIPGGHSGAKSEDVLGRGEEAGEVEGRRGSAAGGGKDGRGGRGGGEWT